MNEFTQTVAPSAAELDVLTVKREREQAAALGLYDATQEHDACGVGFVTHIKGQRSHAIVQQGLLILHNLDHRGAVGADALMGDGAGILLQIPDALYREEMARQGVMLPPAGEYGVGMIFLPKEEASRLACEQELERTVKAEGQVVLGWRDVPVDAEMAMSPTVKATEPVIRQIFIGRGPDVMVTDALERKLYVIRKTASHRIQSLQLQHGKEYFVPSMSARTVVYKGLLLCDQVGRYFKDLSDHRTISAIALVHQRFSTNTFPAWELAHPYRFIAHNGEINTVKGNVNWIKARQKAISSAVLGDDLEKLWPLIYPGQSDTASFDNCLELLVMSGYPLAHAMMMMVPEAWEQHEQMDQSRRAFYEYHAALMEPWDGPAALCFTDGRQIGATLDRNGLRPARYVVTDDDLVILASESGVLPIPDAKIKQKWRLQPGKMLLIDTEQGRIIADEEIKKNLSTARPYKEWNTKLSLKLEHVLTPVEERPVPKSELLDRQQAFGYTQEDVKLILQSMGQNGEEATGSMGNDTPMAVLSKKHKSFYQYFRQLFAQVTNPPIDPIREQMVMSLVSFIGPKPNLLDINNTNPPMRLEVSQPVLNYDEMAKIRHIEKYTNGKFKSYTLDMKYPAKWGADGIEAQLASLCAQAVDAVKAGHNVLVLSDRGVDADCLPIPALLATSAIHQHLVESGLRTSTGLVVETGSAREVHHFALLGGYGAEAVHPYLAFATLTDMVQHGLITGKKPSEAIAYFIKGVGKGMQKVMSKMGISTYMSYTGSQIFEAVGLKRSLVDKYFKGTASSIEGMGLFEVAQEAVVLHQHAFGEKHALQNTLMTGGEYAWRARGEEHMWTPDAIAKLQQSTRNNNYQSYKEYAQIINDQSKRHMTFRGLFEFKVNPARAISIDEVEPATEIVKRFATGAMSLGSISSEAHSTLAVAMNRIGGKSNTGEGGEDPKRYRAEMQTGDSGIVDGTTIADIIGADRILANIPMKKGDSLRSRIKQVASGRFGVTAEYLSSADQIQIKMAQGAKPGEGGQLPGGKVSEYIGALRHSTPGVGLISPPPHHDIYSIEDLAQLIHDLKNVNPSSSISVKLVAETGVGTVAAGVAKAKADHIVIAGHDGGTGASPLSSVKYAGAPWELGLAETQQTLVLNRLRSRVVVQVDGQIKTGRDVVIGALLGAEEFGFATAPLVVQGCIMMRKCHLNTCPVGVATQDPVLRAKFTGQPEHVVNYFFFIAEEVRELMAQLGARTLEELVGRSDLLDMRQGVTHWKAKGLDFSRIFHQVPNAIGDTSFQSLTQDHGLDNALDQQLIAQSESALTEGKPVSFIQTVRNLNRSVGAMLSGQVARRYGHAGLPDDTIHIQMNGTAGQSFAAFLAHGVTFDLVGEGNDYVGKGLSGGRIIVRPNNSFRGASHENIIVGNTVLYGAIAGEAYLSGVAGERFAVRNSGAATVVEGTGDHGCEYMTGGTVVVLGETGRNFAAGMSGGVAYVYDPKQEFAAKCNTSMVALTPVLNESEQKQKDAVWHRLTSESDPASDEVNLRTMVENHFKLTGSERAREILDHWATALGKFVKVMPIDYRKVLEKQAQENEAA